MDDAGNLYVGKDSTTAGGVYRGIASPALNDRFSLAIPFTGTWGLTPLASNVGAAKQSGEPDHAGNPGGHSLWWKWTAPADGAAVLTTNGSSFRPLVAVYQGASVSALTPVAASTTGGLSFNATSGATYYFAVDGADGATGTVSFALNSSGVVGWGESFSSNNPTTTPITPAIAPTGLGPVAGIAGGADHSLGLKSDGTVAGWGSNVSGETTVPSDLAGVTAVAAGDSYSVALKSDGTVITWGAGPPAPTADTLHDAVAIAGGSNSDKGGLALKSDGTLVAWGRYLLSLPPGLFQVAGISARGTSVLAVRNDGIVVSSSTTPANPIPTNLSGVVAVAAEGGSGGGVALKSDGTVTSWGSITTLTASLNNNIIAIAAGDAHALALKSDGTVVAWGSNASGQTTVPPGLSGVVAIAAGDDYSLALQAVAPPVFSAQPTSTAVSLGQTVTLAAAANASSYQWYEGSGGDTSQPVAGANKPWLVTAALSQSTAYWVRATNCLGTADSRTATVTVYPPPPNDDFADATALTGASLQTTGTNAGATGETGESVIGYFYPNPATGPGHSVWWTWTAPTDGVVTVDTLGSDFDTVLGVYVGPAVNALTSVQSDDNGGPSLSSRLSFQATGGSSYQIAVDGRGNAIGNITLNLALSTAFAPSITSQPVNTTAAAGANTTLSVSALAYPPPTYQWQRLAVGSATWASLTDDGTFAGTTTATLTITHDGLSMSGDQYRCVLDNGLAPATSTAATLAVSVPYVFSTVAGTAGQSGSADAVGADARFNFSTPHVSVPSGVAVDAAGNVYLADTANNIIRKILPDGTVTTFAGTAGQTGSTDAVGAAARFNSPLGVAVDAAGNVYVADANNLTIRKILPDGTVTTLAGTAGTFGSADAVGAAASFGYPAGMAVDAAGNVYVADADNDTIRKILPDGTVTTLAGTARQAGSTDAAGAAARFSYPTGVAVDAAGNVYVADTLNYTIRKILPAGTVSTLAGTAGQIGSADAVGAAARFLVPGGVAVDNAGNVDVADSANGMIRRITPNGLVATIGGTRYPPGSADGAGVAASFNYPEGIAVDASGNLYIVDLLNDTIRKGTPGNAAPGILEHPAPQSVTAGQNAAFTAVADGFPAPARQWQRLPAGSSTWANLADDATFAGVTTPTLTITAAHVGLSGDQFRCVVSNGLAPDATSAAATLTVTVPDFPTWAGALGLTGPNAALIASPFPDGVPNLARYAMNLGANPAAGQLPALSHVTLSGVPYVTLQFRERKGLTAVQLGAEFSPDLQTWTPVPPENVSPLADDDANTARYEARLPLPGNGRVFLRLRATQSP